MKDNFDPAENYRKSKERIGYTERRQATPKTYADLGFMCGLEIHQQLLTGEKLFCRCPAGLFQEGDQFDAEVIRHMRPTLSEMGEYDGTALMERKTKKNIIYRIKYETACTYDIDDTPPFPINREALDISLQIALMLKCNIVGELHITRKQYLDGSIPTGFQRTAIVGIEGEIPLKNKKVRIIQLSIEEDACREVSDIGHWRIYTTDRLGMPLIETVTYPELLTPDEAAEAAQYLRFLARSSGKVRTGIGAAREDVNVSITGGTRVEIKGVAHITWIPELTHNEAYRQKALLEIRKILNDKIKAKHGWKITHKDIEANKAVYKSLGNGIIGQERVTVVNLPGFKGLLSFFTQPGKMFADEISDRLKVIACLDRPNMLHSEMLEPHPIFYDIRDLLEVKPDDAQIIIWGTSVDIDTALETIEERCLMAFEGIPNETRKSFPDGTTVFERVLPGPDRMYPDTDSAPISIEGSHIEKLRENLPIEIIDRFKQLQKWDVPKDTYHYLLVNNLIPTVEKIVSQCKANPKYVCTTFGHSLKYLEGQQPWTEGFSFNKIYGLFKFIQEKDLVPEIAKKMLPVLYEHPNMEFDSILTTIGYKHHDSEQIKKLVPSLLGKFREINTSNNSYAPVRWIMGQLHDMALGNLPLRELHDRVMEEVEI